MIDFIKEHWIQYLIGATVAALLGLGLSFYLGEKWSTPESVRAQRIAEEEAQEEELEDLQGQEEPSSSGPDGGEGSLASE